MEQHGIIVRLLALDQPSPFLEEGPRNGPSASLAETAHKGARAPTHLDDGKGGGGYPRLPGGLLRREMPDKDVLQGSSDGLAMLMHTGGPRNCRNAGYGQLY